MRSTVFLLLLMLPAFAFADTFAVTSNADSGPGTLRDALTQAANNGTAVRDSIVFDITNQSEAGRTIVLRSTLPNLTSNLLIDGTTQTGTVFGVSNAPIRLTINQFPQAYTFYFMVSQSSNNIEVDGVNIYQPYWNINSGCDFYGLSLTNCTNIQVGRPLKGNYFLGLTESISGDSCSGITIQSNIDGLDLDGSLSYQLYGGVLFYSEYAINFTNTNNILIGGTNYNQGNHIVSFNSINIQLCYFAGDTTSLRIYNNKLGTDINDTIISTGSSTIMHSNINLKGITASVDVENNIIGGQISLVNLTKYFQVKGNRIYNPDYTSEILAKIAVGGTAGGMIGGGNPGDENQIFSQNMVGVYAINSDDVGVTIYKNNIYCNLSQGSSVEPAENDDITGFDTFGRTFPWVIIDSTANGYVKGRATRNCRIDIYQDDECPACEGKLYLASTTSDMTGNWAYTGSFTGVVVATATDSAGTTFAFTNPFIRDDSMVVKLPTCGKKNGSVKGLKLIGGDNCEWHKLYTINYSQYDSLYSTTLNINNIESGTYILRPKLGSTCNGYSKQYTFTDVTPAFDSAYVQVTQPSCGQNSGSIKGMGGSGMYYSKLEWRNQKGQIVGTSFDITGIGAGGYTLYAIDTSGGGCIDSSKLYVLVNQSGPNLNTDSIKIISASCNMANGSITNISYQNAIGNIYTAWKDSSGKIVSNAINLENATAGKYRFIFKDGSGCDTIVTNYYTIGSVGVITLDTTQMLVTPSNCRGVVGSITGIAANNATIFNWINISTGNTVGNTENITGIGTGSYKLTCSNAYGCSISTGSIIVGQAGFSPDSVLNVSIGDATCNVNNGYITIHQFTADSSLYAFNWVDSTTNTAIPGRTSIQNLSPGFYVLYATDTNTCKQRIFAVGIQQLGIPQFDYSSLQIINDTCNRGIGAVQGVQMKQDSIKRSYAWAWYNNAQQQLGTTPGSLTGLKTGEYYAVVTDQFNCTVTSDTFAVGNYEFIPAAPQARGKDILPGTVATIQVTNAEPGTYNLYDTVNATIPVNTSTTGTLTTPPVYYDKLFYIQYVTGDCESPLGQVLIKVFDSTVITAPNAFSPNGDGIKDTWHLQVQGIVNEFTLTVFNRYGQALFSTHDTNMQWDGTINGKPLPVATYYYLIQARDNNNKPIKQYGYVVILR